MGDLRLASTGCDKMMGGGGGQYVIISSTAYKMSVQQERNRLSCGVGVREYWKGEQLLLPASKVQTCICVHQSCSAGV